MATETKPQEFSFQAEIKELLHLLSHSLYQNKEIAIRELISNAADALDKYRYLKLTDGGKADDEALEIVLEANEDDAVLTIRDNGIGMTHDELVNNLGTIAHSGSVEFLKSMSGKSDSGVSLIGQFGVGFYSSFMLADKVEVLTRSHSQDSGWRWESDGTGTFTIDPVEELERGTQVRLHLKEDQKEFVRQERLKYVLNQYSTFVPHPIKIGDELVNDQQPIWVEPKNQLNDEQYEKFYQYLSHHTDEKPLWHLHLTSDSPFQFHTILYCPRTNFELMGFGKIEHGLHLCAKRILVQNDNSELLPEYLRFLYGLVDSADLPLNVSREALQDNSVFRKIRKVLVKRVLGQLESIAESSVDEYVTFYKQFGSILREGITTDFENRDKVANLLRFRSSHFDDADALTSLDEYAERAPKDQKQIYYIGGLDVSSIKRSPNLEIFSKKNLEVLFLTDPIDEFVVSHLHEFDGKPLKSIDAADLEFPESADSDKKDDDSETSEQSDEKPPAGFEKVLTLIRDALGDRVEEVRESKRLTDSPCCLVNPEGAASAQLQKVLSMTNKDFPMSKRIFEINPKAPLIERLSSLSPNSDHDGFIRNCGCQLFMNAMLLEGVVLDPEDTVGRVQDFMQELASGRSPITT